MAQRQGRGEPQFLSPQEWGEIRRITQEIMEVIPATVRSDHLRHEIGAVLARNVLAAQQAYDDVLAAEEVHQYAGSTHPISQCSVPLCGRYRGQRRDSQPPAAPGLSAYCVRCARSGVGACDDYPNCPGGRGVAQ